MKKWISAPFCNQTKVSRTAYLPSHFYFFPFAAFFFFVITLMVIILMHLSKGIAMKFKIAAAAIIASVVGVGCSVVNDTAIAVGVPKLTTTIKVVPKNAGEEAQLVTERREVSFARGIPLEITIPQGEQKMVARVRFFDGQLDYSFTDQYGSQCGQSFDSMDGICETAYYTFKVSVFEDKY
jgi:hypothetical protein